MPRWTPQSRKAQSDRARAHQPWTRSTGPRTQGGKDRSRYNALKHGLTSREGRQYRRALTNWAALLKHLEIAYGQKRPKRATPQNELNKHRKKPDRISPDLGGKSCYTFPIIIKPPDA